MPVTLVLTHVDLIQHTRQVTIGVLPSILVLLISIGYTEQQ